MNTTLLTLFFATLIATAYSDDYTCKGQTNNERNYVHLTPDNMAVLKGTVEAGSVDSTIRQLMKIQSSSVYLYIDTYGGSVVDGAHLIDVIDTMQGRGKTVHCVADTAMSMGFAIFQACPVRMVRESSILMQHQMSVRTGGELEKLRSKMDFYQQLHDAVAEREAARLNMSLPDYEQRMMNEYYVYGHRALSENAADMVVSVGCDPSLLKLDHITTVYTFFGPVEIVYSNCPLLKQPTSIRMARSFEDYIDVSSLFKQWTEYCEQHKIGTMGFETPEYTCDPSVIGMMKNHFKI